MPSELENNAPEPFETTDAQAAFDHFVPLVASIPAEEVEVCTADPEIVRINARRGVDAIRPHLVRIEKALPLVSIAGLLEIPSLALALAFAADRVIVPASPQEIRARQASLRPARKLTLLQLEILAELGLVPAEQVRKIRSDKGPVDEARDAVAIVALFREHAVALANKHPFDEAYLQKLSDDGNWLLAELLPKGAKPEKSERAADAVLRDRLWTELNRRYDELYKAGVEVWGRRKVDEHLPSLHARQTQPAPAPTNAPAGA
ncbi:hypothetical protein [Polyangium sp. 15x6]|uniref:hypothetical protein n=1 Tax=Polyangium sp. 15x6 TaxID=3042687 RepID=UPI00249C2919|nr:hypothetical protein [Polyangium sp. 15x6]MDI3287098.1 hypothetical protein [Polyangium sp. 15x6]